MSRERKLQYYFKKETHGANPSFKCPQCGTMAMSRYYNDFKKKWIFKHYHLTKIGRVQEVGPVRRIYETIYHEVVGL